jgi:hypothetical protein
MREGNEVTQDDGWASLSSVAKSSPGCRGFLMGTSKKLPMRTMGDVWFGTIHESSMESVWRVDRVFPCRVYIDSNHRDSRI